MEKPPYRIAGGFFIYHKSRIEALVNLSTILFVLLLNLPHDGVSVHLHT
ncbi:hypothetical protein GGD38_005927 [Chitinophagaceae bacterium OAS944]|nr:hypothetical protein [Chitinophagaceae bacterium OAS944]